MNADLSSLERYGDNLTNLAHQNMFSPLIGYEVYVAYIFQILLRKTRGKYNPLLLDSDEQRRFQIIAEAVRRMAVGDAPDPLPRWQVVALNYEALFAPFSVSSGDTFPVLPQSREALQPESQARSAPEYELDRRLLSRSFLEQRCSAQIAFSRLQAFFLAARQTERKVVFFIDHFHRLLGGEPQHYPINAVNFLVPMLARREIQFIGACTLAQHRQYSERDAAILCRLEEVYIKPDGEFGQA